MKITSNNRTTRQMVYISNNAEGMFLSRGALEDLNIIPKNIPSQPQESQICACIDDNSQEEGKPAGCQCPKRRPTPERPDSLPFPATKENAGKLEQWLLEAFSSSAFNTCEQQPLQMMSGVPVCIKFKDDTKPHAVHTAIPVPHHWKKQVKKDLDRDVKLLSLIHI